VPNNPVELPAHSQALWSFLSVVPVLGVCGPQLTGTLGDERSARGLRDCRLALSTGTRTPLIRLLLQRATWIDPPRSALTASAALRRLNSVAPLGSSIT